MVVLEKRKLPRAYRYARFASDGQKDGNSVERRTKAAQVWAERKGYSLSSETYADLGVFAYRGDNASEGRLGAF